jgi:hypothetical protein
LFSEDTGVDTPAQVSCSVRILEWILLLRYLVQNQNTSDFRNWHTSSWF